jgi:hypothetical protein
LKSSSPAYNAAVLQLLLEGGSNSSSSSPENPPPRENARPGENESENSDYLSASRDKRNAGRDNFKRNVGRDRGIAPICSLPFCGLDGFIDVFDIYLPILDKSLDGNHYTRPFNEAAALHVLRAVVDKIGDQFQEGTLG